MVSFNIGLFLLAVPAFLVQAETKLRGNPPESALQRELQTQGYNERLGQCTGATCGLWGDPHMITCDGNGFDCQGIGSFNIMENFMFKIQGRFVDVGAHEHALAAGWGLTEGASLTNDLAIQFKSDPSVPIVQFGFGDLGRHDGTFPAEDGCNPYQYHWKLDMDGTERSFEQSVADCHDRCERTEGCTKFHYWPDGGCHINDEHQDARSAPRNWPRSLAGPVGECGAPHTPEELADEEERYKALRFVNDCPLLMHLDGNLVDISQIGAYEHFYGDHGTKVRIQNINNFAILMQFTTPEGDLAEIHLVARGHGPNDLWSCHFDFWICLPATRQSDFTEVGDAKGLLGTPDGNPHNDFLNAEGTIIGLDNSVNNNWHKTLIDYCYENHCVQQNDSILSPPNGMTFEDIKCKDVTYVPFDVENYNCVLSAEQIANACSHVAPLFISECELDCCEGGCGEISDVIDEIPKIKTLSEDDDKTLYDLVSPEEACVDGVFDNTKDTVCESLTDKEVVKLLSSSDGRGWPSGEIFIDMQMDKGDDTKGRSVKFRINNPFEEHDEVAAYVKFENAYLNHGSVFMDPKCTPLLETNSDCNSKSIELEVSCHDYEGIDPFALVQVYFAAPGLAGGAEVDSCCVEGTEDGRLQDSLKDAVMYSFEIQCACPATQQTSTV